MPENEEILNYIKRAFELKGQECYKQAIEMLYKALAIEPDNNEILYQIGELYFLLHNYTRAIQYLEQILEKDKNHIQSLKLLKDILLRQNEFFRAKEVAEQVYNIAPASENLLPVITIYGKLNMIEEINKYSDEIEKDEKCLYAFALACYQNNDSAHAEKLIQKAFELNSQNEDCKVLLGKILFDKNEFDKSREIFASFGKNSQNPEILNYLGLFALDDENYVEAIKNFSKASNLNSKNSTYLYNLANAYFLNGWKDESVKAYQKAIGVSPENLDYRYSLAYLYYKYKEFDKAKKEVDFVLENNRKHYQARVLKALLLLNDKNYLEAEKILLSNIEHGIDDDFTLSSLSKIETELGKFDKAEKYLRKVIARNASNIFYKCDLGDVYIKEKKFEEALNTARKIITENADCISGYILAAQASYLAKDFISAKSFASEALNLDINCAEGYYYLALVRIEEKDYPEAIECMKRAIMFDLTNAGYYAKMAEIYRLSGDNKSAFDYVKEAESIDNSEEYKILYKEYAALNRG